MTSGFILSVPADLPQLRELLSGDRSEASIMTPEELHEFLSIAYGTPEVRIVATPKVFLNDRDTGELVTDDVKDFESVTLNVKNIVQPDGKAVLLDLDFQYTLTASEAKKVISISSQVILSSGHPVALSRSVSEDQTILLLVKSEVLKRPFYKQAF